MSRFKEFSWVLGSAPDYGKACEIQEILFRTERCYDIFVTGISQTNLVTYEEAMARARDFTSRGTNVLLVKYSRYMVDDKLVPIEMREM